MVQDGKYVDLGDFLPEGLAYALDRPQGEGKEEKASSRKFPIKTPLEWGLAFATYKTVATHYFPAKAREMSAYMAIILRLARDKTGDAWLRYDQAFRQAVVMRPDLQWDRRELDIWMSAETTPPAEKDTASKTDTSQESTSSKNSSTEPERICHRFNRGDCHSQTCKFKHACLLCESDRHGASNCYFLRQASGRSTRGFTSPPPEPKRPAL